MICIQLSDFHLEPAGTLAYGVADTLTSTRAAIDHILSLPQKPNIIVVTGDVASAGSAPAYVAAREQLRRLTNDGITAYVLPGNHDHRGRMLEYLAPWCPADAAVAPYLCYAVEGDPLRLVMLDTTRPGSHSGHFDEAVQYWLEKTLAVTPHKPTLLFTHHPPFLSHMGHMDEAFSRMEALEVLLQKNPHVRLCCGHMHRAYTTLWAEKLCLCAPSTAMQIPVDLGPQGGNAFTMEAPGYVVHYCHGQQCNSYFCQIPGTHSYSGPHPFAGVVNPLS